MCRGKDSSTLIYFIFNRTSGAVPVLVDLFEFRRLGWG